MNQVIIIAAISSRAYVQAALEAGFDVIAIDCFADVDTQLIAKKVIQIDAQQGQFDAKQLLNALNQLKLNNSIGFTYGAGFEAQPDLLDEIALILPIIGNHAEAIKQCKQPQSFFALCDLFAMPYPKTVFEKPSNTIGWLQKTIGASGGEHIKTVFPLNLGPFNFFPLNLGLSPAVYYQKIQAGTPISCLFLADGNKALIIGFNEQWCSSTLLSPYRFGGAVSQMPLSEIAQNKLMEFIAAFTQNFALKGLNSCDFLLQGDDVFMLEINPRLSASVGLYQAKRGNLFASHVSACLGQLSDWPVIDKKSRAIQIIYANKQAKVPVDMDWPEWVSDIPQPNSVIPAGMPICSVIAEARTVKLAKKKVLQRAASL